MYILYHHTICPFSRKIRMQLAAKEINFDLVLEDVSKKRKEFAKLNPRCEVPVLLDGNSAISDSSVIVEFIEEKNIDDKNIIGSNIEEKAEARRLQSWFDDLFYKEVTKPILFERYFSRFLEKSHAPDSDVLRAARKNLSIHFNYIQSLLEQKKYLASEKITIADIAAAAQISCLDYFGDINWLHYATVKEWYSLVKSHKFFSEILKDRLSGIAPAECYSNLDF